MAYRGKPTVRKRIVGKRLQQLREAAGLSVETVAEKRGLSRSTGYRHESGHTAVSVDEVGDYLEMYAALHEEAKGLQEDLLAQRRNLQNRLGNPDDPGQDDVSELLRQLEKVEGEIGTTAKRAESLEKKILDPDYGDRLKVLARHCRRSGWWAKYSSDVGPGHVDLVDAEDLATEIYCSRLAGIPALLETEDYAQAELEQMRPILESEGLSVEKSLELRRRRKEILDRADAPGVHAVLSEACVLAQMGGVEITRAQIDHLVDLSENHENVSIRIMPFSSGRPVGRGLGLTLMTFGATTEGSVMVDAMGSFNDEQKVVDKYFSLFKDDYSCALSYEDSRRYLRKLSAGMSG